MPRAYIHCDNDLGVWVSGAGMFLTFRFMEALSRDEYPATVNVKFGQIAHDRRKYFSKDQELPLGCWDCGEVPNNSGHWQLLAIGEAAESTFIKECDLNNLRFPLRMVGVIMIMDKQAIEARRRTSYFEFDWAINQRLPFVVAAVGYADSEISVETFRESFGLKPTIPVVFGPALRSSQKSKVDPEFAKHVLDALYKELRQGSINDVL